MVEGVRSPIFEKIIQKTAQSTFPKIWDDHLQNSVMTSSMKWLSQELSEIRLQPTASDSLF